MSTEHHDASRSGAQPVVHTDVTFEARDINTRTILGFLLALALSVVVAFAICIFVFRVATMRAVHSDSPLPPSRVGVPPTLPSGPLLQVTPVSPSDPQSDLRKKIAADTAENEKLDWIDRPNGIAQIPVSEAMKLIVAGVPISGPPAAAEKKK